MISKRVRMISGRKESNMFPPFIYHEGVEGIPLIERDGRGSYQVNREADFINIRTNSGYTGASNSIYLITQEPIDCTPYNSIRITYIPMIKPSSVIYYLGRVTTETSYDGFTQAGSSHLIADTPNSVHTLDISITGINELRYLKLYFEANPNGANTNLISIELMK